MSQLTGRLAGSAVAQQAPQLHKDINHKFFLSACHCKALFKCVPLQSTSVQQEGLQKLLLLLLLPPRQGLALPEALLMSSALW